MTDPAAQIYDGAGNAYHLIVSRVDNYHFLKLISPAHRNAQVGHANLHDCGNGLLMLMEVTIENKVQLTNSTPVVKWFRPVVVHNFRHRGLGTHLMRHVLRFFHAANYRRLEIDRISAFGDNAVSLERWYAGFGLQRDPAGKWYISAR
jgi:GNAT superfamily N-acetyltransferase